ncbi:MAG: DUF370 domain-containing protein [Ruminococcaceae bacterium]|nr:DUF370 domain-containing protein [Oscillospiraceae bacterium]
MYLHLGEDTIVKTSDIIGIFDMDTTTVMKSSRNFLNKAEKEKRAVTVSFELPKSFVVLKKREDKKPTVYITQLSSTTLENRSKTFLGYK